MSLKALLTSHFGDRVAFQADLIANYATDDTCMEGKPTAVLFATDTKDVSLLLKLANQHSFKVYPRGAGTGATGGAIPTEPGVVVSFERMNRILKLDTINLTATVEPGVVLLDLKRAAEAVNLYYPPDPASMDKCTIGGNIAECAGGPACIKYGVTRDWVLGLEAVLPTGEIIRTGAGTHKSVAGYDLTRLLIGSEGTLAIVTKAILRLIPKPAATASLLVAFKDTETAITGANRVLQSGILPCALEFLDTSAIRCAQQAGTYDFGEAQSVLLIKVDGSANATREQIDFLKAHLKELPVVSSEEALSEYEEDNLWAARRAISPALKTIAPCKVNEDVVIPRSKLANVLSKIEKLANEQQLTIVSFGHIGDGNIHVNILHHNRDEDERRRVRLATEAIFDFVLEAGGSITGEHGVGLTKREFLVKEIGEVSLAIHRRLKAAFDPNGVLNPGKIFTH